MQQRQPPSHAPGRTFARAPSKARGLRHLWSSFVGEARPGGGAFTTGRGTRWRPALSTSVYGVEALAGVVVAAEAVLSVSVRAGSPGVRLAPWLAAGAAGVLLLALVGYRYVIRAGRLGEETYLMAREQLGTPVAVALAALRLVQYPLLAGLAVTAAVSAVAPSAWGQGGPSQGGGPVFVALLLLGGVALAHVSGAHEQGLLAAVPGYVFTLAAGALLAVGAISCAGGCPVAPSAGTVGPPATGVDWRLIVQGVGLGCVMLAALESYCRGAADVAPAARPRASAGLAVVAVVASLLLVATATLARAVGVAGVGTSSSALAQVTTTLTARFWSVTAALAAALVLLAAATRPYAEFPRLTALLAADRWVPRQFTGPGARLASATGLLALTAAAAALIVVLRGQPLRFVPFVATAVLASAAITQAVAAHALRATRRGLALSAGAGACVTGVLSLALAVAAGWWPLLVLVAAAATGAAMTQTRRHYRAVGLQLRAGIAELEEPRPVHVAVLLDRVDEAAARAVSYTRVLQPASVEALAVPLPGSDIERRWAELAPAVPLRVLQPAGAPHAAGAFNTALRQAATRQPDVTTTALVPETLSRSWIDQLRHHRLALRVKSGLLRDGRIVVADLTSPEGGPGPYTVEEPVEHHVVVLVSAVHQATARALSYAQGLGWTSLRALAVDVPAARTGRLLDEWLDWGLQVPLEILASPSASVTDTVRQYLLDFAPDGRHTIVTCVLPTLVLPRWYQRPLHNQVALLVRNAVLFERGVVAVSVPYRLGRR